MSIILKVENISKQYRLGTVGTGTLSHDLNRWWHTIRGKEDPYLKIGAVNDRGVKASEDYVWALKDVNFDVQQGEVLGIIGKNGSGKSTLLKILSRVTSPTTGSIKIRGRIASLLEVGTGFHGELTGRENIFMNGAVLGMTKSEIIRKLDEIIDFSGCEMYIDTPVKRYSSGMTVRLGFAVAAHLEPEILVVDEVLAVGDAEFQKKAIGKMQDLSTGQGRTVLFVSHNMGSVKSLCTRGLVLNSGQIVNMGSSKDSVDFYLNQDSMQLKEGKVEFATEKRLGDEDLIFNSVSIMDNRNRIRSTFSQSEDIVIKINFKVLKPVYGMRINIRLKTTNAEDVFMTSSHKITQNGVLEGLRTLRLQIPRFLLNEMRYVVCLNAGIPGRKYILKPIDILSLDIVGEQAGGSPYIEKWPGLVAPKLEWSYENN